MWGVEYGVATASGLSGGSGQPLHTTDFAMGGRNQIFVPMEGEDAFGREEDFFDETWVDV